MRKKLVIAALVLAATVSGAYAQQKPGTITEPQDKTQPSPRLNSFVQTRATRLSDQMTRELRLNGYQAAKLRAINEDKIAKMAVIESKYADNPKLIDEQCKNVYKERDQELRSVLSTSQYSTYYGARADFYKYDHAYANSAAGATLVKSVQNPAPASSNGAVIRPGRGSNVTSEDGK